MRNDGFTLLELILVVVLISILAVYATSKSGGDYTAYSASGELIQAIQYAQQYSMDHTGASHAGVRIFNDSFSFINTSAPSVRWSLEKPASISVNIAQTGDIVFDGRGTPTCSGALSCSNATQKITISAKGESYDIYIEPYTGLVHR